MRTPTKLPPALLALAVLAWAPPASATVMVELTLEDLLATADAVVVAEVVDRQTRLVLDPRRGAEPHTFTQLAVREWIAGQGGAQLVVDEIGGTLGAETYRIEGTATYAPGQEVIVFLERRGDGSLRTLAMAQGRFEIRRGIGGVPDSVTRDLRGIAFARFAQGGMHVDHADEVGPEPAVELDVFLTTLRQLARTVPRASLPMPSAPSATGGAR